MDFSTRISIILRVDLSSLLIYHADFITSVHKRISKGISRARIRLGGCQISDFFLKFFTDAVF